MLRQQRPPSRARHRYHPGAAHSPVLPRSSSMHLAHRPATLVFVAAVAMTACRSAEHAATPPATPFDWTLGCWSGFRRGAASGRETRMTMRVAPILGGVGQLRELHQVDVLDI